MTEDLGDRRRRLLRLRATVPAGERAAASRAVTDRVVDQSWFVEGLALGLYLATGAELDPGPLGDEARARGLTTWYPVVEDGGGAMRFRRWDGDTPLVAGAHGIEVPEAGDEIGPRELGAAVLPLVGFSRRLERLGRGGGHYDRAFAGRMAGTAPILCGLAYDVQQDDAIESRVWDVDLDVVVTPTRTLASPSMPA